MEWHRAQLVSAKVLPRCSAGDIARTGVISISVTSVWRRANPSIADRSLQIGYRGRTSLDSAARSPVIDLHQTVHWRSDKMQLIRTFLRTVRLQPWSGA